LGAHPIVYSIALLPKIGMEIILTKLLAHADLLATRLPPPEVEPLPSVPALARLIDHTMLRPEATPAQIVRLCSEAREYEFASVCLNPVYVPLAARQLASTPQVAVCTVIGFPLGAVSAATKAAETEWCLQAGAREIDMVIPIGLMKSGDYNQVLEHIQAVCATAHAGGALVKVILEMAFLDRREKIIGCLLSQATGAEYVKTSTGFGPSGAKIDDVSLMRSVVGNSCQMGVKAAGGIRSLEDAIAMLQAGATRLGTSSGVKIMQQAVEVERRSA
jgi:deoxyribose-phosphate aldolase